MTTKFRIFCCATSLIAGSVFATAQERDAVAPDSTITVTTDSTAMAGNGIEQLSIPVTDGVVIDVVYIPGGTFMMGATPEQGSDAAADEKLQNSLQG